MKHRRRREAGRVSERLEGPGAVEKAAVALTLREVEEETGLSCELGPVDSLVAALR